MTGHQRLRHANDWEWVEAEIEAAIEGGAWGAKEELLGICSLAAGADQVFAERVLDAGGQIEVVIPHADYEESFEPNARPRFESLRRRAVRVELLNGPRFQESAYLQAGKRVVDLAEIVVAVWDGEPAAGLGGTADIVHYAREHNRPVFHLNPSSRRGGWC